ncbi:MAG TPA: hypothetical protein VM408_07005 [Methylomirabilota bacterium]|nr:hypothetical protein [Methylomirabilota bacterium]
MRSGHAPRDGEIEAFIVDRYLESLLAREPLETADLPVDLRATAVALAAGLPRYHPSFRFAESLAARLAGMPAGDGAGELIAFPRTVVAIETADGRQAGIRPAVIGGVLTSAAISLAGAAYVAWRRSRPPTDPWARAIRAAARRRTA